MKNGNHRNNSRYVPFVHHYNKMGLDMFFTEYKINSATNEATQLSELYFRKKYFIANYIRNISFAVTEDTFYEEQSPGFTSYIKGYVLTYDTMVDLQVELNNLKNNE